ncbi:hypothetical protein NX02_20600 [Sphingomonas sanxanigenens DSM 19645 = NX02]|uniref:Thioredoxin domain-containing protein n=2 Tax=Sphingomonas sanxanigenens TaxID=397260 RepID=W0AF72_9SPHN|nr:hypothetical protein NX02_20600 [Sphingomonas sanxanigenens DSM 19645 = NX02]
MAVNGFRLMTFALATLLAMLFAPLAQAQLPAPGGQPNIRAALVAESDRPAAGGVVALAFEMKPAPGWHGYWANPGDAGLGMRLKWTLPPGVTVSPLRYPVPQRLIVAGLMNYVYEADYAQLVTLDVPVGLAPGTSLPIRVQADWLACTDEICVPERAELALDLVVGDGIVDAARRGRFDAWRMALPRPLGGEALFEAKAGKLRLAIPIPASAEVGETYFFPLTEGAIDYAAPQAVRRKGDTVFVEAALRGGAPAALDGVLAIGGGRGLALHARPGAVDAAAFATAAPLNAGEPADVAGLPATVLLALGAALLGGLLLNIMPCVFPIISLKALSLIRAGGDERSARIEALAYTGGVVLTCLLLGGLLLALRAGGELVGWAFQLQDPRIILLLLVVVLAIALNLAGLFEIGSIAGGERLAQQGGAAGAFWAGALAAFVATPCSGPFMATALGAALVLPWPAALAVFGGLGIGLALPFLLIAFVPALRRRMPKPGAWMGRFRRILSIPMFITALGLAWVLGRQSGVDGLALGLSAALAVGLALWWAGRRQWTGGGRGWLPMVPALALALAALVLLPHVAVPVENGGVPGDERFSERRLAALQAEGRPVFVYFTADWCVTCKVNEKAVLQRRRVVDAFAQRNVAVLVGDWTQGDATISRFLERHGRSGVPLYLYYGPGEDPQALPQLLTIDMVLKAIDRS